MMRSNSDWRGDGRDSVCCSEGRDGSDGDDGSSLFCLLDERSGSYEPLDEYRNDWPWIEACIGACIEGLM